MGTRNSGRGVSKLPDEVNIKGEVNLKRFRQKPEYPDRAYRAVIARNRRAVLASGNLK
jgi:hypothetical protein